jgi:hypothetical protein
MATTTNYSWSTPDDTALVKDGALAIRTLGSSVDTTVKNLNPETTTGAISYRGATANQKVALPIGTAGQILAVNSGATAPEWVAATSGGMTLISTTTLTGASVTLSSIPATYNDLRVVIRLALPANDADAFWVRVNGDSGANRHLRVATNSATNDGSSAVAFNGAQWSFNAQLDNSVSQSLMILNVFDYANATTWKTATFVGATNDFTTTTSVHPFHGMGIYNQTAAVTSLQFLFDTGNATSGTILLYGVK